MTSPTRPALGEGPPAVRRADGTTVAWLFALTLLIIPARLVLRGSPLALTPVNIVSLLACLFWMSATFTTTLGAAKGRTPVRTALFVYMVSQLATYGLASAGYLPPDESKLADHALVLVIANVGLALMVCDGVRATERLDFLLKVVVVGGAVIAIIGILQFTINFDLTEYLQKLPGLRFSSEGGFVDSRNAFRRVASTAGHPIEFGVVSSMLLPLAAHFGFQAKERGEPALRWWICTLLIAMGMMFSVSRSAMLGLATVGFILLCGWPTRRRIQALVVSLAAVGLMSLVLPGLVGTLYGLFANAGSDPSVEYRTHRYSIAETEISKHPWLGRGIGTWYVPKYVPFDNQWIVSTMESGLIGVAAFAAIFLFGIYAALRARHLSTNPGARDLALTLAACLVVPLVTSATFDLLGFGIVTGLSFLLIGAAGALMRIAGESAAPLS